MDVLNNLELVEVNYNDTHKKATLVFLDEENGEIREVTFNKQKYVDNKFVDDDEKSEQVDGWCKTYFDTTFDKLTDCVGVRRDVYAYDTFSSLWEAETRPSKFTKDMVGEIYETTIKDIIVDDYFIKIHFDIEGVLYESKMTFGKYMEDLKKWFKDPVKKQQQFKKFEEKFGVSVDRCTEIIGNQIFVEVKAAFGTCYYGDVKKPKWAKS